MQLNMKIEDPLDFLTTLSTPPPPLHLSKEFENDCASTNEIISSKHLFKSQFEIFFFKILNCFLKETVRM